MGELDFTLSGRQLIVWKRIYFSRNQFVGLLGERWRLPFETHLQLVPALDAPDPPAGNLITDDLHPPHWSNQTTLHKGQTNH
ncbi:DUF6531 domain-containing protein [Thorsellia kenyensis]|uniref:DUF6531 domain-containing protein n=1 Tax=Thorsellia kenyensis TaxID=1549888 RepID=A0ABV6C883_9GAMM